ncbi:hypothetical protein ES704_03364 [subsurface metagenome]
MNEPSADISTLNIEPGSSISSRICNIGVEEVLSKTVTTSPKVPLYCPQEPATPLEPSALKAHEAT